MRNYNRSIALEQSVIDYEWEGVGLEWSVIEYEWEEVGLELKLVFLEPNPRT